MIRNLRTGTIISKKELHCRNLFLLALGLRFRKPQVAVLHLPKLQRAPLDMWFVFFPIDVLFLDDRMQVVEIKRGLQPWQSFTSRKAWRVAVEIPSLRAYKVRLGDKLQF